MYFYHTLVHSSSYPVRSEQPTNLISIDLNLLSLLFCFCDFLLDVTSTNRNRIFVFMMFFVILLRFLGECGEIIFK